jgi:hypothetical protein
MISQPSERVAIAAVVNPANNNNTTANTAAVDMSKWHEAMFVLLLGSVDNTTDMKLQESADGSTNWGDIAGKAITQLNNTNSNKQAIITIKSIELTPSKRYVRAQVTSGNGTTNLLAAVGFGLKARFHPGSSDELTSVAQIVN